MTKLERAYEMAKEGRRPEAIIKETGLDARQVKELIQKAKRT